jgi:hypothetical protein
MCECALETRTTPQIIQHDKVLILEAEELIERWRRQYNTIRPHSRLGYRPAAPETVELRVPEIEESLSRIAVAKRVQAVT